MTFSLKLSIETLKLFEALLNVPHEPVLRNLVLRNVEDRAYFNEPTVTNGEVTSEEPCGTTNSESEQRNNNEEAKNEDENGTENKAVKKEESNEEAKEKEKDQFFDKQRIEKIVNG